MKNKKGFSLLEIIVAVFIFSLFMTSMSVVFSRFYLGYKKTKYVQKNLENAQAAINSMAKTMRTSSLTGGPLIPGSPFTSYSLRIFDYSQLKCIEYEFLNFPDFNLRYRETNTGSLSDCGSYIGIWAIDSDIISGGVSGSFYVLPSIMDSVDPDDNQAGRVMISTSVCSNSDCSNSSMDKAKIQTTVSLRSITTETTP